MVVLYVHVAVVFEDYAVRCKLLVPRNEIVKLICACFGYRAASASEDGNADVERYVSVLGWSQLSYTRS